MASAATESRSPSGGGVSKKKLSAACVHCHRRKVRCDACAVGFPCSNCRSAGKTDCRIHEKKKRPIVRSALNPVPIRCAPPLLADPSVPSPSPSQQHQHQHQHQLNHHNQNHNHNHHRQQQQTVPDATSQPLPPRSSYPPQQQHSNHGVEYKQAPGDRLRSEESNHRNQTPQPSSQSVTGREDRREMENRLVTLIDEQDSDRREIQRGVRAIYVGHDVSNMSFLLRQQRGDEASYHFAGNEIPRRRIEIGHDQLMQDALTLPEQSLADELVDAYFTHVNPLYPIVDEEQFMAQYRNRDPADPPPILILQAILLVGAHVSCQKQEREELKNVFFRRCKWLFDSRIERNRDILVQTALLLTWHSDAIDDDVSANAHYWVGVAARIATGLGMHRNPVSNKFAASDRRMWRRVWWILVQYDVLISLSYGRPQAINLEDCDVQSLTPADFIGCGSRVQADFVMHFAELCSMISYILRERFGLRVDAERRKAILPKADEALANWSLGLPDSLRLRSSDIDSSSAMLHLTYNNFLILLHRPHPKASAYSEDYGPHDAEICSAAAGVITSIIEELRQQNGIRYLWCSGVFTVFTAMIQVRVELRFSNPVLAINALRRFDSTLHSLRELADYWSSAETILRLFENSKRLQQDLRVVHNEVTEKFEEPRKQQTESRQQTTSTTATTAAATNNVSRANIPPPLPTPPSMNSQSIISAAHQQQTLNPIPATASSANLPRPASNEVWPSEPSAAAAAASRLDGDTFTRPNDLSNVQQVEAAAAAAAAGMDPPPREYLDWRQLFPFTDPANPGPMSIEGFPDMEDEWRQLYWEPQMTDLFQEGIWLQ